MTRTTITVAVIAAGVWLWLSSPTQAQIAPYVDEHGKLTYINEDSRVTRNGSTISSPSVASQTPPVASAGASAPAGGLPNPLAYHAADRMDRIVREAAERHKVDPALVKAVISTESGWNPWAVSRKGAVGLMQLIPETAQRYGVGNPFDPAQNVEAGTMYLKWLLQRYNGDLAKTLAAYNAGEHAVDISRGVPWYPETRRYIRKVTNAYFQPSSGRDRSLWDQPRTLVRKEVDSNGRVVFTNE